MMANLSGTSFNDKIPVEVTILSSSISIPGNGVGSDPVATMMWSASTSCASLPSIGVTLTVFR